MRPSRLRTRPIVGCASETTKDPSSYCRLPTRIPVSAIWISMSESIKVLIIVIAVSRSCCAAAMTNAFGEPTAPRSVRN